MAEHEFDLIVVGGGPGGYVAAIRAAQLGMRVALVEREHLGGICLNWGCIPTKALLRASEIYHLLHHLDDFGFSAKELSFDFDKVVKRSRAGREAAHRRREAPAEEEQGDRVRRPRPPRRQADRRGREGRQGHARRSAAAHIILATGARARTLPGLEPDGKLIWTYKEAMVPDAMPKSVLVVGSGAIGIEFASFYDHMGAEVTVVEVLERVLPVEDEEISAFARKAFEKRGIKIHTDAKVSGARGARRRGRGPDRGEGQAQRHPRRARGAGGRHHRQRRGPRPRGHQGEGRERPSS